MPLNYIYKISCKDQSITDTYIGSTCNIKQRERQHKSACHSERDSHYNYHVYQFIRANGGWDNWTVTVLLEFECESKMEKTKKERSFIEQLKPTLNTQIPANHQTEDTWDQSAYMKAYREKNKETIKVQIKVRYTENRKVILEQKKEYQKKTIHCDYCNHMINFSRKSQHYKTKKHIRNLAIQNKANDTYQEMKQMHDANVLVWKRINNTMLQINEMVLY